MTPDQFVTAVWPAIVGVIALLVGIVIGAAIMLGLVNR